MTEPTQDMSKKQTPRRDSVGTAIIVAASCFVVYAVLQAEPLQSANDRSRWCTIWSLVERGTYQIDEIDSVARWSTIDKVRHRENDQEPYHFYSSKPPLFPTMVAGLYWFEKQTLGYTLLEDTATVTRLILLLVNALPMVLALFALRRSLQLIEVSDTTRWLLLVAAGFGSMLNPFLTTLNNHTPAAVCLLFSLTAIIRLKSCPTPQGKDFAFVGAFAALTCCFELPAALFGLLSFFVVVAIDWKATAKYYVPAAIIPLAAFFITNWICTGGIKPFYTYYGTEKYEYIHEGVPSYWMNPQGIDANTESTPVYLFHCTLGHHGILSLTPVFLLTIAGWIAVLKSRRASATRVVNLLGIGISCVVLIFYLTRTQNYNYGGNSSALRWMLWLTPFWWFGMLPIMERISRSKAGIALIVLLLVPSIYSPAYSLRKPWRPGWLFEKMEAAGWIDYRTKLIPFDPARLAVINRLPTESGVVNTFQSEDGSRIVLTSGEALMVGQEEAVKIRLELHLPQSSSDVSSRSVDLFALRSGLSAGNDIATWLMMVEPSTGDPSKSDDFKPAPKWAVDLLRGIPGSRPYNIASPRYLKYTNKSGEKTAIRCDRAASRVAFEHSQHGRCWHRCDVFYSDELSFGVARWKTTITVAETNQVVETREWVCVELP